MALFREVGGGDAVVDVEQCFGQLAEGVPDEGFWDRDRGVDGVEVVVCDELVEVAAVAVVHVDFRLAGAGDGGVDLNDAVVVAKEIFDDGEFLGDDRGVAGAARDNFAADHLLVVLPFQEMGAALSAGAEMFDPAVAGEIVPRGWFKGRTGVVLLGVCWAF